MCIGRPGKYSKEELIECGNGKLFTKDGDGRLPSDEMLMFDEIININDFGGEFEKGKVVANLKINPELWFFKCHFPGDPVMPGCLGLDALWQLTGFNLGWRGMEGKGRALGVGEVKFTGMVTPTTTLLTYVVEFTRVIDRKLKLGMANGEMLADGQTIYTTTDMKVGLFKE